MTSLLACLTCVTDGLCLQKKAACGVQNPGQLLQLRHIRLAFACFVSAVGAGCKA